MKNSAITKILLFVLSIFAAQSICTAQDSSYYLKINSIPGSSAHPDTGNVRDKIDVLSFSFGANIDTESIRAGGKPSPQFEKLDLLAHIDSRALTALYTALATGKPISKIQLLGYLNEDGGKQTQFLEIILTEAFLSHVYIEGTQGDIAVVNLGIDWKSIEIKTPAVDNTDPFKYNQVTNIPG